MNSQLKIDHESIVQFCKKNNIKKLSFFGSVLRDDFGPESDVDVLVEFAPDAHIGFIGLASLEIELTDLIGRKVDLHTPQDLSRYFRDQVMAAAEVQYAA